MWITTLSFSASHIMRAASTQSDAVKRTSGIASINGRQNRAAMPPSMPVGTRSISSIRQGSARPMSL